MQKRIAYGVILFVALYRDMANNNSSLDCNTRQHYEDGKYVPERVAQDDTKAVRDGKPHDRHQH